MVRTGSLIGARALIPACAVRGAEPRFLVQSSPLGSQKHPVRQPLDWFLLSWGTSPQCKMQKVLLIWTPGGLLGVPGWGPRPGWRGLHNDPKVQLDKPRAHCCCMDLSGKGSLPSTPSCCWRGCKEESGPDLGEPLTDGLVLPKREDGMVGEGFSQQPKAGSHTVVTTIPTTSVVLSTACSAWDGKQISSCDTPPLALHCSPRRLLQPTSPPPSSMLQ